MCGAPCWMFQGMILYIIYNADRMICNILKILHCTIGKDVPEPVHAIQSALLCSA
jgi:hypothetical protein